MKEIEALKKWLARPGNTKAKIASVFNYDSTTTINKWIERGSIPKRVRADVMAFIKGGKAK